MKFSTCLHLQAVRVEKHPERVPVRAVGAIAYDRVAAHGQVDPDLVAAACGGVPCDGEQGDVEQSGQFVAPEARYPLGEGASVQ